MHYAVSTNPRVPAATATTGCVAVHCGALAALRALSLKKQFRFNLSRREAPGVLPELGELPDFQNESTSFSLRGRAHPLG
jgi:hypothetical protein